MRSVQVGNGRGQDGPHGCPCPWCDPASARPTTTAGPACVRVLAQLDAALSAFDAVGLVSGKRKIQVIRIGAFGPGLKVAKAFVNQERKCTERAPTRTRPKSSRASAKSWRVRRDQIARVATAR